MMKTKRKQLEVADELDIFIHVSILTSSLLLIMSAFSFCLCLLFLLFNHHCT